jgi:hypothetical protein
VIGALASFAILYSGMNIFTRWNLAKQKRDEEE